MSSVVAHWLRVGVLLFLAVPLQAQEVTFSASAPSQVTMGEQFQVTFTLSGGSLRQYRDFRQPDMNVSFLTLMGPSTSQQMQIVNGRVSTSISWTYVLQPRNTGTFDIGPASISYDGSTLRTTPVRVKVVAAAPGSGGGGGGQKSRTDAATSVDLGDNLFIKAIADRRSVYVGEPITVTYKLYSRVAFQLSSPIKLPRMIGFWSEDLESPTQLKPVVETLNGKQYETYSLKKVVYFPTQSGALSIDPFEIDCIVQVRQRRKSGDDFFDRFFSDPFFDSYSNVKKTLLTEKVGITAKPLPERDQPASFRGSVGSFTLDASLDKTSVRANETVTLRVVVRGAGNIKLLEEPTLSLPSSIDRFDPRINEEILRGSGSITGVKSFEYLLVPRYPGTIPVEPVEFSYFDPERGSYVTLRSRPFELLVAEGDPDQDEDDAIAYARRDILPPYPRPESLEAVGAGGPGPVTAAMMFALPLLACIGALMWKRSWDRRRGDVVGLRMRRAGRVADRHLSRSRAHLNAGDTDAYYLEIARALWGYIQHKLALPTSETSIDVVGSRLRERSVSAALIDEVRATLEAIEYARFSPTRTSRTEMAQLYQSAKQTIVSLEQTLRVQS